MINNIFKILFFIFTAILTLGLIAVLFSIGLVVMWYLLLLGLIIWGIRRLYYFFKGEKPPTFVQQYADKKKQGRVIDYDEFKDK